MGIYRLHNEHSTQFQFNHLLTVCYLQRQSSCATAMCPMIVTEYANHKLVVDTHFWLWLEFWPHSPRSHKTYTTQMSPTLFKSDSWFYRELRWHAFRMWHTHTHKHSHVEKKYELNKMNKIASNNCSSHLNQHATLIATKNFAHMNHFIILDYKSGQILFKAFT